MSEDRLHTLSTLETPAPSEAARRRALDAAMAAFDRARQPPQGSRTILRLRSGLSNLRGIFAMNARLTYGLGTAALALLLLPLGYQLYTTTAFTPPDLRGPIVAPPVVRDSEKPDAVATFAPAEAAKVAGQAASPAADAASGTDALRADDGRPTQQPQPETEAMALTAANGSAPAADAGAEVSADGDQQADLLAPGQPGGLAATGPVAAMEAAPPPAAPKSIGVAAFRGGGIVSSPMLLPAEPSGDQFTRFQESPVKVTANEPVSTFSIDVDTASYAYVRRMLTGGVVPEPDAVRIEEMVNYFPYDYPLPDDAARPFKPTISVYPTPWNARTEIVQIGIKGYVPPAAERKPSNLVFLIDTSGSMDEPDKLPLLKRAFALLVDQLGDSDTISIVTYAGSAGVVLPPTRAEDKATILKALDNLEAGGSTAGAEGIALAYQLAEQNKVAGGVNRVILATDGDFNVGIDDPDELKTFIKSKRDGGVSLSVLGFGEGNLGDDTMQALAQNGNGNASYIDSFKEARKVLVAQAGGTLDTIAKDVKIQVEFNPAVVAEYRLIGYETRALNREDFNNDKVDAGDIGAGTTVTALYEITPKGSGAELDDPLRYGDQPAATDVAAGSGEIGYLKMRYKLPDSDVSQLMQQPIEASMAVANLGEASADSRWAAAVAAFAQKLRGSNYGDMEWTDIRNLAQGARGTDEAGYRAEFMQLIDMARTLEPDPLCTAPPQNRNCR
jgi:Ca-activated chloride channel family protein